MVVIQHNTIRSSGDRSMVSFDLLCFDYPIRDPTIKSIVETHNTDNAYNKIKKYNNRYDTVPYRTVQVWWYCINGTQ